MNYYNEHDQKAAAWLRELIAAGHIPPGEVDTRSITEIKPDEIRGFTQCHFFAGIGGWPLALALAGVDSARPLWTGSCPCQPFTVAGKGKGVEDERHLWPVFARLIAERRPPIVFGEQVASKAGRDWLHGVRTDLEGMGYAVGAADLCAAGVGAPHIRQRLYWVADNTGKRWDRGAGVQREDGGNVFEAGGDAGGLGDAIEPGLEGHAGDEHHGHQPGREHTDQTGPTPETSGAWDSFDLLHCTDGKTRRIESGTFPLDHGVPGRVGLLRGYGNAIVPQVAAEFVTAYFETH